MTSLVRGASLEMTGKDAPALREAAPLIAPGTEVNVTFLGTEDLATRLAGVKLVVDLGFRPVPHISARRLSSQAELEDYLGALRDLGASASVFCVGGDPHEPMGPYDDSLQVIETGLLQAYGVTRVAVAGYPDGHPDIPDDVLWKFLEAKATRLAEAGLSTTILTQLGFNADSVLSWIGEVRDRGIAAPVRVGVPGPAGVKRLLGYAARFGVSTSAGIVRKYGFSLTNLLGTAGPDRFVADLARGLTPAHGEVGLHFYTFGGLGATAQWIHDALAKERA